MWCVAPQWPAHARHVAVEFVHPVIVGKRALPAVSVDAAGAAETVRLLARPGDILLVVEHRRRPRRVATSWRRADAWGLTSLWLGAGTRPARAAGRPGPTTWCGSTTPTRRWRRARATSCSSTTCCGS